MDYKAFDDQTLIQLIVQAQPDALSELYDRYGRLVFSVAFNLVGDQATAEEITLDIFTRVWRKAGSYRDGKAEVRVWLTSMTRYRAIDILRRQGVRAEQHSVSWDEVSFEPVSSGQNPETAVGLAAQKQRIRAALAELPPEQKKTLALAYFRGYSHREIAALLNEPLGTVKTRIRLALQKLRYLLLEEEQT